MPKTPERVEYLTDVLTTAIENGGYGFFYVLNYAWEDVPEPYAVIEDKEDEDNKWTVNLDTIAKGLGVIRKAVMKDVTDSRGTFSVLHNADTGQRLYMDPETRARLLQTSVDNDAEMDAIDALAILECALFGAVTYA